jgi:hypothetical protein
MVCCYSGFVVFESFCCIVVCASSCFACVVYSVLSSRQKLSVWFHAFLFVFSVVYGLVAFFRVVGLVHEFLLLPYLRLVLLFGLGVSDCFVFYIAFCGR